MIQINQQAVMVQIAMLLVATAVAAVVLTILAARPALRGLWP